LFVSLLPNCWSKSHAGHMLGSTACAGRRHKWGASNSGSWCSLAGGCWPLRFVVCTTGKATVFGGRGGSRGWHAQVHSLIAGMCHAAGRPYHGGAVGHHHNQAAYVSAPACLPRKPWSVEMQQYVVGTVTQELVCVYYLCQRIQSHRVQQGLARASPCGAPTTWPNSSSDLVTRSPGPFGQVSCNEDHALHARASARQ